MNARTSYLHEALLSSAPCLRLRGFMVATLVGVLVSSIPLPAAAQTRGQGQSGTPLPHPEIAPPVVPEAATSWWLLTTGIVIVVLLLALVIWLLFLRKAVMVEPPAQPLKIAIGRLEALQQEIEGVSPSDIGHRVSVIVRDYLQAKYAVPAIYRTTQELYGSSAIQAREGLRDRFGPVAEFYDRLEFAPQPATQADGAMLIEEALRALRDEKRYCPGAQPPALPQSPPSLPFMPTKM